MDINFIPFFETRIQEPRLRILGWVSSFGRVRFGGRWRGRLLKLRRRNGGAGISSGVGIEDRGRRKNMMANHELRMGDEFK